MAVEEKERIQFPLFYSVGHAAEFSLKKIKRHYLTQTHAGALILFHGLLDDDLN